MKVNHCTAFPSLIVEGGVVLVKWTRKGFSAMGKKELFWLVLLVLAVGMLALTGNLASMLHFVQTMI